MDKLYLLDAWTAVNAQCYLIRTGSSCVMPEGWGTVSEV